MLTYLMLLAHGLSDFALQSDKTVRLKEDKRLMGYVRHGLTLLVLSLLFIANTTWETAPLVVGIVALHLLIDGGKAIVSGVIDPGRKRAHLLVFVVDQALHLGLIFLLTSKVKLAYAKVHILGSGVYVSASPMPEVWKFLAIFVYIVLSGAFVVPKVLDVVYENVPDYTKKLDVIIKRGLRAPGEGSPIDEAQFIDEVKTGKWIGLLERALIVIFLVANQLTAIAVIIAIKSLTRFKMLDNKVFSEYYLLGTLLSVTYTVIGYYGLNAIL